jgi:alkylation response protein AidB-like acyl-CoA dehydrogenase
VPRENRVGALGTGWKIAMTVLGYERGASSLAQAGRLGTESMKFELSEDQDLRRAATAKGYALASVCGVTRDGVQIHGGNGFTWEYDLHCLLKRAMTLDQHRGATAAMTERALRAFEATI